SVGEAHLGSLDKDMTLTKLRVLLLVAHKGSSEVLVRELTEATGFQQSTIARVLGVLGDKPMRGLGKPLGLISARPDPEDPRRNFYSLSSRGRRVVSDIISMINSS
ncbi:MarR family winged helix-turn-helix transcriptional regulator, partial [Aestuariivita boseongensis]|uniref:MarR family winged helix-turn-helix transcriptional regulator n=1 Tax=Aestuariivita boseongensis TaxID=1470562 RepID=UPI001C109376